MTASANSPPQNIVLTAGLGLLLLGKQATAFTTRHDEQDLRLSVCRWVYFIPP